MSKRGQVTIFIIVGVLILIVAGVFLYSQDKKIAEKPTTINTAPITSFVEQCLKSTAQEGIFENGKQGGYFILPEYSTTDLFEDVPYFVNLTKFPQDKVVAQELGSYIDTLLDFCLDFSVFEKQGYNITLGTPVSEVSLNQKEFQINTNLPLKIKLSSQSKELSTFGVKVPATQFYSNLETARKILGSMDQEDVCLTCFSDIASKNKIYVGILPIHNQTYVFDLKDTDYLINKEIFHFKFGVKYNESE